MQKSFIAIALALTLTCTFAAYSPIAAGYVKAPQSVAGDNESNFTNSGTLGLISATIGELDLLGANSSAGTTATTSSWAAAYRKLDGKALTASTNSSVSFNAGNLQVGYFNGYAVSYTIENDGSSIPQVSVYQTPLNGGAALGKIVVSSNTNANYTPSVIAWTIISKTVYVFYNASATANGTIIQINVTNFAVGGAKGSLEFNLTTAYSSGLNVVWGEALGSNQLFANWIEGGVLKDATVDLSKGTATTTVVNGWNSSFACTVFSTDKKFFGDICFYTNAAAFTTSYYVRASNTTLTLLVTNATNTTTWTKVYPYGPYIAITYTDSATTVGKTTLSYDIWNVDSFTPYRNKTAFVTYDSSNSSVTPFRVTSGGLYTLLSNVNSAFVNGTIVTNHTSIQVGLVLGSSYLTSVLGFILTIVAGLLLF
jgi:hypothetical protein